LVAVLGGLRLADKKERERGQEMGYYDGDPWSNHIANWTDCAECEEYFDDQEGEGNICPSCIAKEGEEE
jgi:hypothetical protein